MAPRIGTNPAAKIDDAEALSRVHTPGVAEDCRAIAEDPAEAAQCAAVRAIADAVPGAARQPGHDRPLLILAPARSRATPAPQ